MGNNRKIDKQIVFKIMCELETDKNAIGIPISIGYLSDNLMTSKHQVTKYMHELETEMLVKLTVVHYDPETNKILPKGNAKTNVIKGWALTDYAKQTVVYKEAVMKTENLSFFDM